MVKMADDRVGDRDIFVIPFIINDDKVKSLQAGWILENIMEKK